jgi:AAA domain
LREPGVLLFAAEDALHIVRRRLEGISAPANVALASLDIQVITAPTVRLDLNADRRNLAETVASLQPRLLVLDPFVRLHRIDENASGEVAPLLAYAAPHSLHCDRVQAINQCSCRFEITGLEALVEPAVD